MPILIDATGNPLIVKDAAIAADTEILAAANVFIKYIYWFQPTTIGHLATIKDRTGRLILPMYCEVANQSQMWPIWSKANSIHIDDLDSGEIYIFIR